MQQTRIGKYVNEMRRKTADRILARRAKDLVRKWQQLVASQSSSVLTAASTTGVSTTSSEIGRVASSGSLADSGSQKNANGVQPSQSRSVNGRQCRAPTSETDKQLPGSSTADVSRSRYQPTKRKTSSSAEKTSVMSSSHALFRSTTPVTTASFQHATLNSLSRSTSTSPVTFRPQTPSPRLTATSTKLPTASASTLSVGSSKLSPISHCVTNGTDTLTASVVDEGAGPLSKMKLCASTDALLDVKRKYANGRNGMLKASSSSSNLVYNGLWTIHSNTDTDIGTADRTTSSPDPLRAEAPLAKLKIKINRTSASGSVSSPVAADLSPAATPASARKTPKVATTAELIQRLHANGELRLVASETLNRIATNQIEHEVDERNTSIVPEGAKPRPHKKRRTDRLPDQLPPAMTDSDLLQVKAERVRSFVQMSANASSTAGDSDLLGLLSHLPQPTCSTVTADVRQFVEPEAEPADQAPTALQLPSLEGFKIDWDSDNYTMPDVRPPPTDADVDRLINEQWPSVNGQFDYRGDWTDWTESYSAHSYNDILLHILPYVDIDD